MVLDLGRYGEGGVWRTDLGQAWKVDELLFAEFVRGSAGSMQRWLGVLEVGLYFEQCLG